MRLVLTAAAAINAIIWFGLTARFDAVSIFLGGLVVLSGWRLTRLLVGGGGRALPSELPVRTVRLFNYFLRRVLPSAWRDTWTVIRCSLLRHPGPAPAIVAVRLPDATPGGLFLLCYSLTLSPGNQVMEIDEGTKTLYVHALYAPRPEVLREKILEQYLNFIKGITE